MTLQLQRLLRLSGVLLLACLAGLVTTAPADAAPRTATAGADAVIRAAHFSPTTPGVDVYLTRFSGAQSSTAWLKNVSYGSVSSYQPLTPGVYTVAMRPAGASAKTRPMLTWTLRASAGQAYTVAGVGANSAVRGVVIADDLTAPPAGQGRVRVIQAASRAPVANVQATTGAVIADNAKFASVTKYADLPAGTWNVKAVSKTMPSLTTLSPVDVRSGQITSILLLDGKSTGITLRTLLDSSSSGVMPVDAIDAGAGATATHRVDTGSGSARGLELAGLLLLAGVLLFSVRSRSGARARHLAG